MGNHTISTEGEHVTTFGKVVMKVTLITHMECVLIKMVLCMSVNVSSSILILSYSVEYHIM